MYTQNFKIKNKIYTLLMVCLAVFVSSCGTHNQNNYGETDGIYGENAVSSSNENAKTAEEDKANYYKQYFQSKDKTFEDIPEEGAIFTDIDTYSTTESLDEDGYVVIEENDYEGGNDGWGSNPESVTVNVYNSGYYGHNYWHNPYGWYGGWGYPFYGYGGYGYGWGYPYYFGGYYPYYGGYYNPYYGGGYYGGGYYGGYNSNNVAYNRGRRNTDYQPNRNYDRGRSSTESTRSYSRTESDRRYNARGESRRDSRVIRGERSTRPYDGNRIIRNTRPQLNSSSRPTRSSGYSRPSSSSNSGNSVQRSSGSRSSSSSTRSSGGSSSRSSGSSSGSSSRRGGGK